MQQNAILNPPLLAVKSIVAPLAPPVPAQVLASINGEISRFLFNEILEILML
jgi:hypothetical protein